MRVKDGCVGWFVFSFECIRDIVGNGFGVEDQIVHDDDTGSVELEWNH